MRTQACQTSTTSCLCEFTKKIHKNEPEFHRKTIMSDEGDEAHFNLGGYVNKQNCHIWGSENPKMIIEKPLCSQRVTVCCDFWAGGIIRPYVFEN